MRFTGAQLWDPPADRDPAWLDEPGDPWVLVTTSTEYQADEQLARVAVEALRDEPVRVLLTLADAYDAARIAPAGNVRVERFVPHGPVLERAAAVVCHSGMGIVQKAIAAGVPIAAVPFGRDQPEVARPRDRGRRRRAAAHQAPDARAAARHGARGARDAPAGRAAAAACAPAVAARASPTPPRSSCRTGSSRAAV